MLLGFAIGIFTGATIGFFICALLAMSGNIARDQEIAELRRREP